MAGEPFAKRRAHWLRHGPAVGRDSDGGSLALTGNGDVMGSLVARTITIQGNAAFHYDEALANLDSNEPFSISKWREITSGADCSRYLRLFEGF